MGYRYEELTVWQRAMQLAALVYEITAQFPPDEKFGLTAQIRRAIVSVPSNIAEGQGRLTRGEFRQFLGHARGSLYEVKTQIALAEHLGYCASDTKTQFEQQTSDVANLLNALLRSLSSNETTRNSKLETRN